MNYINRLRRVCKNQAAASREAEQAINERLTGASGTKLIIRSPSRRARLISCSETRSEFFSVLLEQSWEYYRKKTLYRKENTDKRSGSASLAPARSLRQSFGPNCFRVGCIKRGFRSTVALPVFDPAFDKMIQRLNATAAMSLIFPQIIDVKSDERGERIVLLFPTSLNLELF